METERLTVLFPKTVRMDLDKNRYLQHMDYELELEFSDLSESEIVVEQVLNEVLTVLSQTPSPLSLIALLCRMMNSQTKSERFFARMQQGDKEDMS